MSNREEMITLLRQHYPHLAAQYRVKKDRTIRLLCS